MRNYHPSAFAGIYTKPCMGNHPSHRSEEEEKEDEEEEEGLALRGFTYIGNQEPRYPRTTYQIYSMTDGIRAEGNFAGYKPSYTSGNTTTR